MSDKTDNGGRGIVLHNLEQAFSIGRLHVGHVLHQDAPGEVSRIKRQVSNIQHALDVNKNDTWWEIVLHGIAALDKEIEDGKKGKMPARGTPEYQRWAVAREATRLYQEEIDMAGLLRIYEAKGTDGFTEWCTFENIDPEPFFKWYARRLPAMPQSERDRDWLRVYLEDVGGTAKAGEIRAAAIDAGLIDSQSDWNRLEQTAGRSGLVAKDYGKWTLRNNGNF